MFLPTAVFATIHIFISAFLKQVDGLLKDQVGL